METMLTPMSLSETLTVDRLDRVDYGLANSLTPPEHMDNQAPYHAHIYYTMETRDIAVDLKDKLIDAKQSGAIAELLFIGELRDRALGPHPIPEYEIHFTKAMLPAIMTMLEQSGLTALVHPLTDDDLADHTTLATWIGAPLPLKLETLDPPGVNQGVARFGKSDF
jgi:aromatic ring-cleaving dioxygenase